MQTFFGRDERTFNTKQQTAEDSFRIFCGHVQTLFVNFVLVVFPAKLMYLVDKDPLGNYFGHFSFINIKGKQINNTEAEVDEFKEIIF